MGYEVFKDKDGKWRWRLKAANGEIVAQSEAYDSEWNAKRGSPRRTSSSQEGGR
jgi:uncharacterized protein YegP (UPF0339 family)